MASQLNAGLLRDVIAPSADVANGYRPEVVLGTGSAVTVTNATAANLKAAATLDAETTKVIGTVNLTDITNAEYETVAASQTTQAIGATGATGDYLAGVLVVPATTTPGVVTILDNTTAVVSFPGGASSVTSLVPFFIPLGIKSVSGAWKITTGTNVSCVAVGNFT